MKIVAFLIVQDSGLHKVVIHLLVVLFFQTYPFFLPIHKKFKKQVSLVCSYEDLKKKKKILLYLIDMPYSIYIKYVPLIIMFHIYHMLCMYHTVFAMNDYIMIFVITCHMMLYVSCDTCHRYQILCTMSHLSHNHILFNHFCTNNWGQLKQKSLKCHFHFSVKYSRGRNSQRSVFCNSVKPIQGSVQNHWNQFLFSGVASMMHSTFVQYRILLGWPKGLTQW